MTDVDAFALLSFEQAKRFLEKASAEQSDESTEPNLNAALLLGFCSLEAHLNSVAAELSLRKGLELVELSILLERDFEFDKGIFSLSPKLKMFRFEDRLGFVLRRFAGVGLPKQETWWADLQRGLKLRNELVHPKAGMRLRIADVEKPLAAILSCLDALYRGVFGKKHPALNRGLNSRLSF